MEMSRGRAVGAGEDDAVGWIDEDGERLRDVMAEMCEACS